MNHTTDIGIINWTWLNCLNYNDAAKHHRSAFGGGGGSGRCPSSYNEVKLTWINAAEFKKPGEKLGTVPKRCRRYLAAPSPPSPDTQ